MGVRSRLPSAGVRFLTGSAPEFVSPMARSAAETVTQTRREAATELSCGGDCWSRRGGAPRRQRRARRRASRSAQCWRPSRRAAARRSWWRAVPTGPGPGRRSDSTYVNPPGTTTSPSPTKSSLTSTLPGTPPGVYSWISFWLRGCTSTKLRPKNTPTTSATLGPEIVTGSEPTFEPEAASIVYVAGSTLADAVPATEPKATTVERSSASRNAVVRRVRWCWTGRPRSTGAPSFWGNNCAEASARASARLG